MINQNTIEFQRTAGVCLLFGSVLATVTMALHPIGGDIEHIIKIKNVLILTHSIAIFCLPFIGFGFWGFSKIIMTKNEVSILAFIMLLFSLIAAMLAATLNGLVLPLFASRYALNGYDTSVANTIIGYGHEINSSMTFIVIVGITVAMSIWSFLIIQSGKLPVWLGYHGVTVFTLGFLGLLLQFKFTDLIGFRIFVVGLVSWIVAIGINLIKGKRMNGFSKDYQP